MLKLGDLLNAVHDVDHWNYTLYINIDSAPERYDTDAVNLEITGIRVQCEMVIFDAKIVNLPEEVENDT